MNNKYIFPVAIFVISIIVFIITLNPTVSFTDNGELAGVAYNLGIAHPSGYPLFTILGHIWSMIPMGWTIIYKLNLFAAVLVSLSGIVFYYTILLFIDNLKLVKENKIKSTKKSVKSTSSYDIKDSILAGTFSNKIISFALTLTFLFSVLVWEEATVYEVYSLQFLLINLSFYFLLKGVIFADSHKKNMALSGLMIGLSFANHLTTILIIPAVLYIYFKRPGSKFDFSSNRIRNLIYLILIAFIGLTFYLYLPLRSMSEPTFNWGYVHRGLDKFMYHLQGKQYQVWMFSGMEVAFRNFGTFLANVPYNLAFVGIIAVFAGFYRLYKSYREYLWFFVILFVSCVVYSVNYSIHDIDVYFYLAVYSLMFFTAAGILLFVEKFEKYKYIVLVLPLINLAVNFSNCDKSKNYLVYDYTRNVVDNLGQNAIIISNEWDYWISAFWYLQKVENYRPDITVIDKELLRRTWYSNQLKNWDPEMCEKCKEQFKSYESDLDKFERGDPPMTYPQIQKNFESLLACFISTNINKRPVYVTFDYMNAGADASPLTSYNIIPSGYAFKLETFDAAVKMNFDKLNLTRIINYPKDVDNHLEKGIMETSSLNMVNIGRYAAATGDKIFADSAFRVALKIYPDNEMATKSLYELERLR
jgi:hypothetical protein